MGMYEDPRFNPETIGVSNNVADLLRNSLDSLHELPEEVRRIETFSEEFLRAVAQEEDKEAIFNIDKSCVQYWLTRNVDVVDEYGDAPDEPQSTIWPIRKETFGGKYLGSENYHNSRNDIINRQAETLSGAIGKLGSDYYVDAFRQALEGYQSGNRIRRVEGTSLTWLWHDLMDEYKPDTELDFHTLLANELKMRFVNTGNEQLAEFVDDKLVYDLFIMEAGDAGVFPEEIEKLRTRYWNAANSLVKLLDTDPYILTADDYQSCLNWCENFADMQDMHPTTHGEGFTDAFARDIGVEPKTVDIILAIGSRNPHQIIRPEKNVGQGREFGLDLEWAIPKHPSELPELSDNQTTVLGALGYLSALRQINTAIDRGDVSREEAKTWLLEFIMNEDFIPVAKGDISKKEELLRTALGNEAVNI